MKQFRLLIFLILGLVYSFPLLSIEKLLALRGKIIDAETGEPLRGATIQVVELPKGTFSDPQGNFKLTDLPLSTFSLKISYIGYQTKIIEKVEKEKIRELLITLYPEVSTTQEVTVEAKRVFDNEEAVLSMKKGSNKVLEALSIDEIKRLPVGNVGQALRRIPGVTLINDFIIVRGISERYNNATINGSQLPSTEVDKKTFSFDLIPSDFVENVSVFKSYSPELPANFAGGLVEISTNDFPSQDFFKISISTKSNSNTTFKQKRFNSYEGGKLDWLGFEDGSRNLPSEFPSSRLNMNSLLNKANNPFDTSNAKEKINSLMHKLFARNLAIKQKSISPIHDKSINLSFGKTLSFDSYEIGISSVGRYVQDHLVTNITRNAYLANFDTLYTFAGTQSTRYNELGALLNFGFRNEHNILTWKNTFINNSEDEVLLQEGKDMGFQFLEFKNFSFHYTQKTLASSILSGKHFINQLNSTVNWQINLSNVSRKEPDYRRFRFSRFISDAMENPFEPFVLEVLPNQQGDGTRAGRFYSNLNEHLFNTKIDFIQNINRATIKYGIYYNKQKRIFNARSITITTSPYISEEIYDNLSKYWALDSVFAPENFDYDNGLRIGEDSKLSDSYDTRENNLAAYVLIDLPITLINGFQLRFVGGARFERNMLTLNSFDINDLPVNVNYNTNDILPAINLIFKTSKSSNLRIAASQTLTRPSYREFAPFAFYDYYSTTLVQGNPNLKISKITNLDCRFETFPNISELFSVGIFYKLFKNAIEETIYPQQSELTRTYANAEGNARNIGLEFELRKNLGFITNFLNSFHFTANLTLVSSSITVGQGGQGTQDKRAMWGQSPYVINLGLFYRNQKTGTSISFGYNTFGKRIVQVVKVGVYDTDNPHIYELPRHILDLGISQKISQIELKLGVKNLLNSLTQFEQNGKKWTSLYNGHSISFEITYSPFN